MSDAIPPGQFPEWKKGKFWPMSNLAMALGQVEEAMGALDDNDRHAACEALVRARQFILQAADDFTARVPLALLTPITDEEAGS